MLSDEKMHELLSNMVAAIRKCQASDADHRNLFRSIGQNTTHMFVTEALENAVDSLSDASDAYFSAQLQLTRAIEHLELINEGPEE